MSDAIIDNSKTGPMLGKKRIDLETRTTSYFSEIKKRPYFTVTIAELPSGGTGNLIFVDALGNEHTQTFSAVGQFVSGGPPGSSFPIPMWVREIKSTSTVLEVEVAW